MIASTHLAVGAAVGLTVQIFFPPDISSPEKLFWAFAAGFISHLLLDAFPHQEYGFGGSKLGLVLFVEFAVIFVLLLSPHNSLIANAVIFFGMAGGAIPDVIDLAYVYVVSWPWLGNLGSKIHFCHGAIPTGFAINFYFQLLIALIAVLLIRIKPSL